MHHIEHVSVEEPARNHVQLHSHTLMVIHRTLLSSLGLIVDLQILIFNCHVLPNVNLIILQSEYNMAYKSTRKPPKCKITVQKIHKSKDVHIFNVFIFSFWRLHLRLNLVSCALGLSIVANINRCMAEVHWFVGQLRMDWMSAKAQAPSSLFDISFRRWAEWAKETSKGGRPGRFFDSSIAELS